MNRHIINTAAGVLLLIGSASGSSMGDGWTSGQRKTHGASSGSD